MMKKVIFYILALVSFVCINAQNTNRVFKSVVKQGLDFKVEVNDGYYIIKPFSSEMIETTFVPNGESLQSQSHAVVAKPQNSRFEITDRGNDVVLKTNGLYVTITKSPFQISYYYKNNFIVSEKDRLR